MKDEKEDKTQDAPSVTEGGVTGEYEFSSPVVYGGGTGEYEFGVVQNKNLDEHIRDANPDHEDEDDLGSTLLLEKPNVEKPVTKGKAERPERVKPAVAIQHKHKPKHKSSVMDLGLFVAFVVLFITFIGVTFFFVAKAQHHFQTGGRDPAIALNEPMPEGTAKIPALSKPVFSNEPSTSAPGSSSQKVVYALGYAPYTAAPQGGLKYKSNVITFRGFSDDKISELEAKKCAEISLEGVKINDHNLQHLSKLKNIYMLDLQNSHGFSPKGIFVFKDTTLKRLHLDGTGISDEWIPVLESLPVECLTVMGNNLSEESLATLAKSKTLKFLKFEANPSKKINDTFSGAGWMRLPEGNERAFNYYRESPNTETH